MGTAAQIARDVSEPESEEDHHPLQRAPAALGCFTNCDMHSCTYIHTVIYVHIYTCVYDGRRMELKGQGRTIQPTTRILVLHGVT
jgi:hypothetical protein